MMIKSSHSPPAQHGFTYSYPDRKGKIRAILNIFYDVEENQHSNQKNAGKELSSDRAEKGG